MAEDTIQINEHAQVASVQNFLQFDLVGGRGS